uniref:Ribsomal protein S11 n=1 Tax=Balamuthia mandrillaris TaxID=66527 RepID=A0A0K1HP84_9EUKA|nr:ribsomal protein S11 [Balamuthia mandrillaris]
MSYRSGFLTYFLNTRVVIKFAFLRYRKRFAVSPFPYLTPLLRSVKCLERFGRPNKQLSSWLVFYRFLISVIFSYFSKCSFSLLTFRGIYWGRSLSYWFLLTLIGTWFANYWPLMVIVMIKKFRKFHFHFIGQFRFLSGFKQVRNFRFVTKAVKALPAGSMWRQVIQQRRRLFELRLARFKTLFKKSLVFKNSALVRKPFVPYLRRRLVHRFCILTYKLTRSNIYVTVTDTRGNVFISRSAGSLGLRKRWERHYYGTFAKLLDICLRFVKKNRLASRVMFYIRSYKSSYNKMLAWKTYCNKLYPDRIIFAPTRVHGLPLRQRRLKRL